MTILFRGPSPHYLGTAETGYAKSLGRSVELMLDVLDDWHNPNIAAVRINMTPAVARTIADQLMAAARDAESGQRIGRLPCSLLKFGSRKRGRRRSVERTAVRRVP